MIFERFDVCGRMKNAGQERFLLVLILLLVSLAGLSDVSAFAADREQQVKVGKKRDITFRVETRVGSFALKPGRYFIRHRVAGDDHFIQFTEVTKRQGKNVGGFPRLIPGRGRVPATSHGEKGAWNDHDLREQRSRCSSDKDGACVRRKCRSWFLRCTTARCRVGRSTL